MAMSRKHKLERLSATSGSLNFAGSSVKVSEEKGELGGDRHKVIEATFQKPAGAGVGDVKLKDQTPFPPAPLTCAHSNPRRPEKQTPRTGSRR